MWSRAVCVTSLFAALMLAGCADEAGTVDAIDRETFVHIAGTGAIAGLLMDDRFRPIELVAPGRAQSEFQAEGFILVQETGQKVLTDESGEFVIVNLHPGQYTLRATVSQHEATPQHVQVTQGAFAETQVVARRVFSTDGVTITTEYVGFIPCSGWFLVSGGGFDCTLDQSGESERTGYTSDYTGFGQDVWLVTELKAPRASTYSLQTRATNADGELERYVMAVEYDIDYLRFHQRPGVLETENDFFGENQPWRNDLPLYTTWFELHPTTEYVNRTVPWPELPDAVDSTPLGSSLKLYPPCCGVGINYGSKGTILQTLFLGTPEVDVTTYCVLC